MFICVLKFGDARSQFLDMNGYPRPTPLLDTPTPLLIFLLCASPIRMPVYTLGLHASTRDCTCCVRQILTVSVQTLALVLVWQGDSLHVHT